MNREEFTRDLEELARLSVLYIPEERWIVKRDPTTDQIYAECSSFVAVVNGKQIQPRRQSTTAKRMLSLCFSETYQVPVLWFNFYDCDGHLVLFDTVLAEILLQEHPGKESRLSDNEKLTLLREGISQNEHPVHGITFYNLHPCRTAELLQHELKESKNLVISLLTFFGPTLGYHMPLEMIRAGVSDIA